MCQFVESIKLLNGEFYRLNLHQERVNRAFAAFYPNEEPIKILENLNQYTFPQQGIYKCRIVYDTKVKSVEFTPYVRRDIKSLKLVETKLESRAYKLEDRSELNAAFTLRESCDDILLIKNGLLTDTSYSNIALFDGKSWITPRIPLLYGVNRAQLLADKMLEERDIKVSQLKNYQQIALFNAMIEFGELTLGIDSIIY
jgi:4-amino-4-deoxychorismate lyase